VATQAQFFPQKFSFVSLAPPFFLGVLARMPKLARKEKANKQTMWQNSRVVSETEKKVFCNLKNL
jgi:hypothetical protein